MYHSNIKTYPDDDRLPDNLIDKGFVFKLFHDQYGKYSYALCSSKNTKHMYKILKK